MAQTGYSGRHCTPENRAMSNQPTHSSSVMFGEEEMAADVDEPPDLERTPRPSALKLHESFTGSFSKRPLGSERKESMPSMLTSALNLDNNSPVDDALDSTGLRRGMSSASSWSNHSSSTAELTSDGGLTSPGTRTRTPSPPPPAIRFHMVPVFNKTSFDPSISIVRHDDEEHIEPLQKVPARVSEEKGAEVNLGRKRCIKFACGPQKEAPKPAEEPKKAPSIKFACGPQKEAPKPSVEYTKPQAQPTEVVEPTKRTTTIKFACPGRVAPDRPVGEKPRIGRALSPAPQVYRSRLSPKPAPKAHRDSNSTVRTISPISTRRHLPAKDRTRRLSVNSDLARCEAFRFHEFASSEEEVEEWVQESTCHRSRLTIADTLKIENTLRKLGEEAEEEAIDDDDEDMDDEDGDEEIDDDEDEEEDDDEDMEDDDVSDEGFQTDDEEGFAVSDDESDAGSDFAWWTPGFRGPGSTAATSMEQHDFIRPSGRRSVSVSSVGSANSDEAFKIPKRPAKKSRPMNIRVPSPELPDSTDFVCGTLDEDRPLEAAYMSCLERRRAAKHKLTPQDIDPTFPTSDPEIDEEDDDDEDEEPDRLASENDGHLMMHGQMDAHHDPRGRSRTNTKRSPGVSPKRLRSPPPPAKRVHRSPPPRKLFGQSPKRTRSPVAGVRLRSPPPTRRGSQQLLSPRRPGLSMRFNGLAERPALTTSSSLPRTPVTTNPPDISDDEDTCCELPVSRRAIDIKIGLEKKRQRRKEQQYRKLHRKGAKDKRPAPGKGYERMREMGLGLAAHKGKNHLHFAYGIPPTPDQKDMHVLSI